MKKIGKIFFMLLLTVAVGLMASSCDMEKYDSFTTLTGFVLDKTTNSPLDGVTITLSPGGKNMVTGTDGYFEFANMDAQQYNISAQRQGYVSERKWVSGIPGETVHVNITLSKIED